MSCGPPNPSCARSCSEELKRGKVDCTVHSSRRAARREAALESDTAALERVLARVREMAARAAASSTT